MSAIPRSFAYLLHLKTGEKSTATINRKLASIRSFFSYLVACGHRTEDPTKAIRSPRAERKSVDYLTLKEVENLLTRDDPSFRGLRDKALLELLYASGMRASEATAANVEDVNLRIGFIVAGTDRGKARLIPAWPSGKSRNRKLSCGRQAETDPREKQG